MRKLFAVVALALLLGATAAHADIVVPESPPRGAGPDVGLPEEPATPPWAIPVAVAAGVAVVAGAALAIGRKRRS